MDLATRSVVDRLKAYDIRFESLLQLATTRPVAPEMRASTAQNLRALKQDLDHDYRSLITSARYGTLTQGELAFLLPAIEQALADLHIRDNADPSTKIFHDSLQTARRGIRFTLTQLDPTQPAPSRTSWPISPRHLRSSSSLTDKLRTFTSSLAFRCGLYFLACHRYLNTKPSTPDSPR